MQYTEQHINRQKLNPDYVEEVFKNRGYELTRPFENTREPVYFICPHGHVGKMSWQNFRKGCGCVECYGTKRLTTEIVRERMNQHGYTLMDEYVNTRTLLKFKCPKGHIHAMRYNNFHNGARCAICSNKKRFGKYIR